MAYIPVFLDIFGIEADARITFTLTTPGAYWSMGHGARDSLGFSFNARQLGVKRTSNVRGVEIAGQVLEIQTCTDVNQDPTTLTLFVFVPSEATLLEGCCTFSDQTRVIVSLGDGMPIEWKGRLFSSSLQKRIRTARRVTFSMNASKAGEVVLISLMAGSADFEAHWCLVPQQSGSDAGNAAAYYRMLSPFGTTLPLQSFSMDACEIKLITGTPSDNQNTETLGLSIETYIECLPVTTASDERKNSSILLRAKNDDSVTITAQIGALQPRYLMREYTQFIFDA